MNATATIVTVIEPRPVSVPMVQLSMSVETAGYLFDITSNIAGAPEGPRGHFDQIRRALEHVRAPDGTALKRIDCQINVGGGEQSSVATSRYGRALWLGA